jgi:hypothetical protein
MAWEPDYITTDEFKTYVGIELNDTTDDVYIALDITAASRAVDACCSYRANGLGARRQFGHTDAPESRYYTPRWDIDQARWVIEIDDLMSVTGLAVTVDLDNDDVYESTITNYTLRPRDALANNRPYTQISVGTNSTVHPYSWTDSAKVAANTWGWTTVPSVVKRATLIQAHRFNKRRVSPFGVKGSPQKQSQQSISDQLDADIEQMLSTNNLIKLSRTV